MISESSVDGLISHMSIFYEVKVIDIRSQSSVIKNIGFIQGNITNLDIMNNSIESLFCLHAAEHIGLEKYGDNDNIDLKGTGIAVAERRRIMAKGGSLDSSLPIGKEKVCFNAHRVHFPETILEYFDRLTLKQFFVIDDTDSYIRNGDWRNYFNAEYSRGLFHFERLL